MKNNYFEGYYFKHQKGQNTLCIIVGKSNSGEFIQVITNNRSWHIPYIKEGNIFTDSGIKLNIKTQQLTLIGQISYHNLSPIKYDIMGPFKTLPMECKHGIVSMYHKLDGKVILNGAPLDFTDGIGYIEKDSGTSFPSSYVWIHANDFKEGNTSIVASVATIPFLGFNFRGCICVVYLKGKEYRLATYLGAKIIVCNKNELLIKQGKYKLYIKIENIDGQKLKAPSNGIMIRNITEAASCKALFKFYIGHKQLVTLNSQQASFEYEI